jgi:hypothetical protein
MIAGFGCGIPWQLAASDPGYYERALGTLFPPHWYSWKYDALDITAGCTPHTLAGNWGYNLSSLVDGLYNVDGRMCKTAFWRDRVFGDTDAAWLYNAGAGRVYAEIAALGA